MGRFNNYQAQRFAQLQSDGSNSAEMQTFLQSDVCTGMEIVADNAIKKWQELIGPNDAVQAKLNASTSIRAAYGTNAVRNAVHGSGSAQQKKAEMDLFFDEMKTTALMSNCKHC